MLRTQPPRTGLVDLNLPAATVWTGSSHACRRSAITVNLTGNHPVDGALHLLALLL